MYSGTSQSIPLSGLAKGGLISTVVLFLRWICMQTRHLGLTQVVFIFEGGHFSEAVLEWGFTVFVQDGYLRRCALDSAVFRR